MKGMVLQLVIFDCDGVLVDSEPVSREVIAQEAASLGWALKADDAKRFTGMTWSAIKPVFEAATSRKLAADWPLQMQERVIAAMAMGVAPMPGARAALEAVAHLGLAYRVASNSSHQEMQEKFGATGFHDLVEGRVHSARDVVAGKPAPDLFLAAAASAGVAPASCLVVEDSSPGVAAAQAAGMRVALFAPEGDAGSHASRPDYVLASLADLPGLCKSLMMEQAA